jgi:hypothetical protein
MEPALVKDELLMQIKTAYYDDSRKSLPLRDTAGIITDILGLIVLL